MKKRFQKTKNYYFQEIHARTKVWYGPYRAENVYQAFRIMQENAFKIEVETWRDAKNYWVYKTEE